MTLLNQKTCGYFLLIFLLVLCLYAEGMAQCPMCRSAAESNLNAGGSNGRGLNAGILYMLAGPYVIVSTMALLWWRHYKKYWHSEAEIQSTSN